MSLGMGRGETVEERKELLENSGFPVDEGGIYVKTEDLVICGVESHLAD